MRAVVLKLWLVLFAVLILFSTGLLLFSEPASALKVRSYSDLISDSGPNEVSNHTFRFTVDVPLSGNSYIDLYWPDGFTVPAFSETFDIRNVELLVNGVSRTAAAVASPGVDQVEVTPGSPGSIRYTFAPNANIPAGTQFTMRVGNQTTNTEGPVTSYSTSTGTTTTSGDLEPIVNATATGTHEVYMEVYNGGLVANAGFLIAVVEKVQIPNADTTEEIPPYRFNPTPTSTVGGTTLNVEIGLETDEFSICRYSETAGVSYGAMSNTFSNTGLIFHSTIVPVVPETTYTFYVRCIDDEGNFNIDDFLITFQVGEVPTGQSNTEGETDGDGTGSGNEGSGDGSGGGGSTGNSDGDSSTEGSSSGSGGSGGGGGGGSGGNSGGGGGGGPESSDGPYRSGDGTVVISGYAFPQSEVTVLVDGQVAETARANSSAAYTVTLDAIARGVYTFGVYAKGSDNVKSATFSTSFTVSGARTTELTNINVSPSIKASPDPVTPGQTLTLSGYALPNALVTVENGKQRTSVKKTVTVNSSSNGFWTTTLDTNSFSRGTYEVRAKAEQSGGNSTAFSSYTYYGVGQQSDTPLNADFNQDSRVNLTDFSILLYWWNTSGSGSDPSTDINRDGRVNLTDFSIMLFNWTG